MEHTVILITSTYVSSLDVKNNLSVQRAEVVNAHGGDVTVVYLPEIGIKGNIHFLMFDLNNLEIANHFSVWLKEKSWIKMLKNKE